MKRKAPSDSTLQHYWRLAVKKEWGAGCVFHDSECWGDVQCHHIIKRDRIMLKHLPENGIPVCEYHHEYFVPTMAGREAIRKLIGEFRSEMLDGLTMRTSKDYLVAMGMTREEFLTETLASLKKRLAE